LSTHMNLLPQHRRIASKILIHCRRMAGSESATSQHSNEPADFLKDFPKSTVLSFVQKQRSPSNTGGTSVVRLERPCSSARRQSALCHKSLGTEPEHSNIQASIVPGISQVPLPGNTSFVSASGGGAMRDGVVTWTVGTLSAGQNGS